MPRDHVLPTVALAVCVATVLPAQVPVAPQATSAGSRVLSPTVVATAIFETGPAAGAELQLLVLWRGSPGWFLGAGRSGGWTSGQAASRTDPSASPRPGVVVHEAAFGGRTLRVRFDREKETAEIGQSVLSLRGGRAVLVDGVDGPTEPFVVGTRSIGTQASGVPPRIEPLLSEVPELVAFLQCDRPLEDAAIQAMLAFSCRTILGP